MPLTGGHINRLYIWLGASPQHNLVEPYIKYYESLYIDNHVL